MPVYWELLVRHSLPYLWTSTLLLLNQHIWEWEVLKWSCQVQPEQIIACFPHYFHNWLDWIGLLGGSLGNCSWIKTAPETHQVPRGSQSSWAIIGISSWDRWSTFSNQQSSPKSSMSTKSSWPWSYFGSTIKQLGSLKHGVPCWGENRCWTENNRSHRGFHPPQFITDQWGCDFQPRWFPPFWRKKSFLQIGSSWYGRGIFGEQGQ